MIPPPFMPLMPLMSLVSLPPTPVPPMPLPPMVAVVAASAACALAGPWPRRDTLRRSAALGPTIAVADGGRGRPDTFTRWRWLWALLAGLGAWGFLGGPAGVTALPIVAGAVWWWLGRVESPTRRRRRERAAAQLPHLVLLIGCALRAGCAPDRAVSTAGAALPGPAADELVAVIGRLHLGADAADAWSQVPEHSPIAPLARALARAHRSGGSVRVAVERLADDLARARRGAAERRARTVGVRAAVPLGLCLLPAFLLIGVVPMVAGLARSLVW